AAGARSTLGCALGLDDLAACLRALVGAAHVDEPLALASILALARVLRAGAGPLALARVDAATVHLPTSFLRGTRYHGASEQKARRGARNQHAPSTSVHSPSLNPGASQNAPRGYWTGSHRTPPWGRPDAAACSGTDLLRGCGHFLT